ncbi:MAG: hypothetical protein GXY41_09750 [Phycisphaerae bacterium]|nr:hypothetical protein [Phycisphaerae bacterium]
MRDVYIAQKSGVSLISKVFYAAALNQHSLNTDKWKLKAVKYYYELPKILISFVVSTVQYMMKMSVNGIFWNIQTYQDKKGWLMCKLLIWEVGLITFMSSIVAVSEAEITVYTDKTEWENALSGSFVTEDFSDSQLNFGVSFVSTESGHINPAQEFYQDVLASTSQNEPTTRWSFASAIIGFGGNWTLGGPGGSGNYLLIYIDDLLPYVGFIPNSYGGEFWGFISDTPFTSVRLVGGTGNHQQNYCLDDMVYSQYEQCICGLDLNSDGIINLVEFAYVAAEWQTETIPVIGDITGDGQVNIDDLAKLGMFWLGYCLH